MTNQGSEDNMPVDPISESLWNVILKRAKDEDKKDIASGYWVRCPSCGRRVVKKQLIKKGCYLCGWKEGENKNVKLPYKMKCPGCGREVITEELKNKGCFICGYKPEAEDKNNG